MGWGGPTFDAPIARSTFTDNTSDDGGGSVRGGIVDVRDSTFTENVAPLAGAIQAENTGGIGEAELTAANSTFTANRSTATGGVLDNTSVNPAATSLRYVTFAGNRSAGAGADISVGVGGMTVFGTVFADPVDAPSCSPGGPVRSSYSYATDTSCLLAGTGDTQGAPSPGLGPLADNGGSTRTRAPLTGSPLLEGVPLDACDLGLLVDQRGLTRPRDADESTPEYGCDLGAVELGAERPDPTPTTSTTSTTLPEPTTSTSTTTTVAPGTGPAGVDRPVAVTPRFTG